LATIGGVRIADRGLRALREATGRQLVVANDPRAAEWFSGLTVVADQEPGLGPLAGLASALRAADGAPIIVLAWDMPFVTGALLGELAARGVRGAAAVLPVHGPTRQREPLCAFYSAAALTTCRSLLEAGERRALALAVALTDVELLDEPDLASFGDPEQLFLSVDTPEQLAEHKGTLRD
jgi:molybdopterin-guanine dinucleotide biosynthesis protein A